MRKLLCGAPDWEKLPSKAASKLQPRKTAELPPKPEAAELPQESPELVLPPKAASLFSKLLKSSEAFQALKSLCPWVMLSKSAFPQYLG